MQRFFSTLLVIVSLFVGGLHHAVMADTMSDSMSSEMLVVHGCCGETKESVVSTSCIQTCCISHDNLPFTPSVGLVSSASTVLKPLSFSHQFEVFFSDYGKDTHGAYVSLLLYEPPPKVYQAHIPLLHTVKLNT